MGGTEKAKNPNVDSREGGSDERPRSPRKGLAKLKVGENYRGTVESVKESGAQLIIADAKGFLSCYDPSWGSHLTALEVLKRLKKGDELDVVVSGSRRGSRYPVRVKGIPPREKDPHRFHRKERYPWIEFAVAHQVGSIVKGKVCKVNRHQAWVDFGQHITSSLHIHDIVRGLGGDVRNDLEGYLSVGDSIEAVVADLDVDLQVLEITLPPKHIGEFDKELPRRHDAADGMDHKISEVAKAVQTLAVATEGALQEGLALADLNSAKSREIADAFLAVAHQLPGGAGLATESSVSEAASSLGKKRAATLTPEHQRKAANARSEKLSAKRRSEIAKDAAAKRWKKSEGGNAE